MELRAEISNPSKRSGAIPNCVHVSDQGEVLSGWSDGQLWCHDLSGGLLWNIHSTHVSPNGTVNSTGLGTPGSFPASHVEIFSAPAHPLSGHHALPLCHWWSLVAQGVTAVNLAHSGKFVVTGALP